MSLMKERRGVESGGEGEGEGEAERTGREIRKGKITK